MMECPYKDPKYVILQAWTNNVTRESIDACKAKAKALINATLCKFSSAHIIISRILPRLIPTTKSNTANRPDQYSQQRSRTMCPRVSFADHVQSFVAENGQIRKDLYWDEIHLNKPSRFLSKGRGFNVDKEEGYNHDFAQPSSFRAPPMLCLGFTPAYSVRCQGPPRRDFLTSR